MTSDLKNIKVLIVEDDPIIALDLQMTLEKNGCKIVGVAHNASEAYDLLANRNPEFALLDVHLGTGDTGIDIAGVIRKKHEIPFIFLTSFSDDETVGQAKEQGPFGYLVKPFQEQSLLTTISIALDIHGRQQKQFDLSKLSHSLTKQEENICKELCNGKTYQEISDELFVSVNTVRFHVKNIYQKAEVSGRAELVSKLLN